MSRHELVSAMIDDKSKIIARAALLDYLKSRHLRRTPERFAILDKVCEMSKHFSIDTLYRAVEADGYHVSRATIYNTMDLLTQAGIVHIHRFDGDAARYERVMGKADNHLHLICRQCGKIKEVKDPELARFISTRNYSTFHPAFFDLYIHGICGACSRRRRRTAKTGADTAHQAAHGGTKD